jgi:hypothetical protein
MEWWHIYLFTRLDSLNGVFFVVSTALGIILAAVTVFLPIILKDLSDEGENTFKKWLKIAVAAFVVSLLGVIAVPTQKEAAAIYLLPKLAKSDFAKEAQQIPTEAAKLMRLKLESWVADTEPKKTEGK